eukprot:GHVU01022389.1.p1 GENE.GHVU01022389.1~~GHVU01022389.1.p1  ORF type:complete len:119 (-),score=8.02 GHVU01022389.1:54-410(-)
MSIDSEESAVVRAALRCCAPTMALAGYGPAPGLAQCMMHHISTQGTATAFQGGQCSPLALDWGPRSDVSNEQQPGSRHDSSLAWPRLPAIRRPHREGRWGPEIAKNPIRSDPIRSPPP